MYEELKLFFDQQNLLEDYEWNFFKQLLTEKSFKKGELIIQEGTVEKYLSFIAKGGVRIYYLKNGNEKNIDFRLEKQFTSSYTSFLTQLPSRQYIEAIEDTHLYMILHEDLQMAYNMSKNGEHLGRLNAELLFTEKEVHEALIMLDSPQERFNKLAEHKKQWLQRIPQKYLASYLNITPETFSRLKKRSQLKSKAI